MTFIERCKSGEFRGQSQWTDNQRNNYLKSKPIHYESMKICLSQKDKEEIQALINVGIIKF